MIKNLRCYRTKFDPDFPIFGPEVGEEHEEVIQGLQYEKGNRMTSFKIKNYSPKIVKISKKKMNTVRRQFYCDGPEKRLRTHQGNRKAEVCPEREEDIRLEYQKIPGRS